MRSRRDIFSGFAKSFQPKQVPEVILRPPYFENKDVFYKGCIECDGVCASVCKERIIQISSDKTPKLDFATSGCTYCDECALACPHGVLKLENKHRIDATFAIDMLQCMSWNQTMCFSCKDPCLDNAITFLGMFRPSIDTQKCTSCGFCVGVCPSGAITIGHKAINEGGKDGGN